MLRYCDPRKIQKLTSFGGDLIKLGSYVGTCASGNQNRRLATIQDVFDCRRKICLRGVVLAYESNRYYTDWEISVLTISDRRSRENNCSLRLQVAT